MKEKWKQRKQRMDANKHSFECTFKVSFTSNNFFNVMCAIFFILTLLLHIWYHFAEVESNVIVNI